MLKAVAKTGSKLYAWTTEKKPFHKWVRRKLCQIENGDIKKHRLVKISMYGATEPKIELTRENFSWNRNLDLYLTKKDWRRKASPKNSEILPTPGLEPGPHKDVVLSHACLPIPSRGQMKRGRHSKQRRKSSRCLQRLKSKLVDWKRWDRGLGSLVERT